MPITTDAVAISKKAVNKFIQSDEYRKCKKADLIFAEFLSDDGGKLFLFEPNRVFQVNENEIDGIPNRKVECTNDKVFSYHLLCRMKWYILDPKVKNDSLYPLQRV